GVELEPCPQRPHVDAVAADFPQHPRPAERQAAGQERLVERPDPQRDDSVETAYLADHLLVHSLTIVREFTAGQCWSERCWSERCWVRAGPRSPRRPSPLRRPSSIPSLRRARPRRAAPGQTQRPYRPP